MDFKKRSRHNIKKYIIKNKLMKYECDKCKIFIWNGKKLSLHLDHINGISTDNRLENLRFLCPNCHSLTETYCGNANKGTQHYNINNKKVSDDELLKSIQSAKNIKEALTNVGLAGANNYKRVKKLAITHNITHIFDYVPSVQIKNKIEKLKESNIDFTKFGWVTLASEILEITPQKTRKFIERNAPELLNNAFIRKY